MGAGRQVPLVLGSEGLIGRAVAAIMEDSFPDTVSAGRVENDITDRSRLEGGRGVARNAENHLIVRTSWPCGEGGASCARWVIGPDPHLDDRPGRSIAASSRQPSLRCRAPR